MKDMNREYAEMFVNAIKELVSKPDNIDNFEGYLSHHFDVWMEKYANTPAALVTELKHFAKMEI